MLIPTVKYLVFLEKHLSNTMRYFTVFLFCLLTTIAWGQNIVRGVVRDDIAQTTMNNVSVINLSTLQVVKTNSAGEFAIEVNPQDILHFTQVNYRSFKLSVTNDWIEKNEIRSIYMKEDSEILDEIVINSLRLTGILQIDTRLIAFADYPYTKDISITGYTPYVGFNPIESIYRSVKKNSKNTQNIKRLESENQILDLMKSRYDRDLVSTFLEIPKVKIIETLQSCDYSEEFIYTSSDYQIFIALKSCLNSK